MERKEVLEKLEIIFKDVFDEDDLALTEDMKLEDIGGWDSFAHINIIHSIEEEFNVKIPLKNAFSMKTVAEIINVILDVIK